MAIDPREDVHGRPAPSLGDSTAGDPMSWVRENRRSLIRRAPWLEVFEDRFRLPDGTVVPDYYAIELPDYCVVAALTDQGDLVAETQYRPGAGRVSWTL